MVKKTILYFNCLLMVFFAFQCNTTFDLRHTAELDELDSEESDTDSESIREVFTLKEKYEEYFRIGAAVDYKSYISHADLIETHFNSITAENEMKFDWIQRSEGEFTFGTPDRMVDFAEANKMEIRGHALIWHRQTPSWVFAGVDNQAVTREKLLNRMEKHISAVLQHYKGRVKVWDVVNEAIMNDGSYRTGDEEQDTQKSKWFEYLGESYIAEAFKMAHKADPEVRLFYNDYYNYLPEKQQGIYNMLKGLLDDGVPVHGVGLQCHLRIEPSNNSSHHAYYQTVENLEKAILLYSSIGLDIQITEMDISIYSPNISYTQDNYYTVETFTKEIEEIQAERYREYFELFRKHSNVISSVTFWGIADDNTWLSELSSKRQDFPLLFDTEHQPKLAFDVVFNF